MPHTESDVKESIFLNDMPEYKEELKFAEVCDKWNELFDHRDVVMKALELARAEKLIGKSLDAKVTVYTNDNEVFNLLSSFADELATIYIVSKANVVNGVAPEKAYAEEDSAVSVMVEPADGKKCARCWAYAESGIETEDGGFLCDRCRAIIES